MNRGRAIKNGKNDIVMQKNKLLFDYSGMP